MYVIIIEVRKKKKRYNKGYLYTKGNYKIFVISRDDGVWKWDWEGKKNHIEIHRFVLLRM